MHSRGRRRRSHTMSATHASTRRTDEFELHEIRVQGNLDEHWADWLEGLAFTPIVFGSTGMFPNLRGIQPTPCLRRIERQWLRLAGEQNEIPAQRVARSLAELVFLWAVIPTDEHVSASGQDAFEAANELVARLDHGGRAALAQVFSELRQRT